MHMGHSSQGDLKPQCPPPPPLSAGGPENFSIFAKRGGLAVFEFLGGSEFFQGGGGGAGGFQKVIFSCKIKIRYHIRYHIR